MVIPLEDIVCEFLMNAGIDVTRRIFQPHRDRDGRRPPPFPPAPSSQVPDLLALAESPVVERTITGRTRGFSVNKKRR